MIMPHVASIISVAFSATTLSAQVWTQLSPVTSPSGRGGHAMTYDGSRQRVVVFGGAGSGGGEHWEWSGTNWTPLTSIASPSARAGHAMVYDETRQRVVLFGGLGVGPLGDTWEWDGTNWFLLVPSASPSIRSAHAMAYDSARQRVVLFGGVGNANWLGDTWQWDGTNWTQMAPSASPSARFRHAMAYDAARQRVVLFGGLTAGAVGYADTWEWDGANWIARLSLNNPGPRYLHAMAYDSAQQRVVMFGGTTNGNQLGDTWEWDGTNWFLLTPSVIPLNRTEHAMAYDAARQRVVLFGGWNNILGPLGDTWVNGTPTTLAYASAYGAGCGSPALGFVPDTNGRPLLGHVASATITGAPTPVAGVAVGWSNQLFGSFALPVALAGIGMTGCDLWQSADILGLGTSPLTPSTLSFSLAIPSVPSLIGFHLYLQAYAFALGVNPLQVVISNGIEWTIGNV